MLGILFQNVYSQSSYAEKQVVEFSNIISGNNFYSGDIYCFENTKVSFQLRVSSFSGRFDGTVLFTLGDKSYSISGQEEDYFREVRLHLPEGKSTVSITAYPDVTNNNLCRASVTVFETNKGDIGSKNSISTTDN